MKIYTVILGSILLTVETTYAIGNNYIGYSGGAVPYPYVATYDLTHYIPFAAATVSHSEGTPYFYHSKEDYDGNSESQEDNESRRDDSKETTIDSKSHSDLPDASESPVTDDIQSFEENSFNDTNSSSTEANDDADVSDVTDVNSESEKITSTTSANEDVGGNQSETSTSTEMLNLPAASLDVDEPNGKKQQTL